MRIPKEDLNDFIFYDVVQNRPDPPARKTLHPTGEIEVLKPLAVWEGPVMGRAEAALPTTSSLFYRFSEFHRTLMLAGAFAIAALAVSIGIPLWLNAPLAERVGPVDTAADSGPGYTLPDELTTDDSDLMTTGDTSVFGTVDDSTSEPEPARPTYRTRRRSARRSDARSAVRFAAVRVRPRPLLHPQFIVSEFVPTTLIIYVEGGVVRSRIEPQLAAYKKALSLPN
jgi:hypothetical protein